jgi:hypothetical protein
MGGRGAREQGVNNPTQSAHFATTLNPQFNDRAAQQNP